MLPQEQQSVNDMTADEAKASLGVATFLQDQLMPQGQQQDQQAQDPSQDTPDTPPDGQGEAITPETDNTAPPEEQAPENADNDVQDLTRGFDEFKGEVKGIIESKFDDLTKTIRESLKD